jgi:hypothetical protein
MNFKEIKDELKTILQGKSQVSHGELIQTISLYLRRSKETSALVEAKHYIIIYVYFYSAVVMCNFICVDCLNPIQ